METHNGLKVPARLNNQTRDFSSFSISSEDLEQMKQLGWTSIGIAPIIINKDNPEKFLFFEHRPDQRKIVDIPKWGTSSETTDHLGDQVERPTLTLARGMFEELGVWPETIKIETPTDTSSCLLHQIPIGDKYADKSALAISPILFVDDINTSYLISSFRHGNGEIINAGCYSFKEIKEYGLPLRNWTADWLDHIRDEFVCANGLFRRYKELKQVVLPRYNPDNREGWKEVWLEK